MDGQDLIQSYTKNAPTFPAAQSAVLLCTQGSVLIHLWFVKGEIQPRESWTVVKRKNDGRGGEGRRQCSGSFFSLSLAPHPTLRFFSFEFGVRVSLRHTQKNRQQSRLFTFLIVLTNIGSTIFCRRKQLTENFYSVLYYFGSSTIKNFYYMNV